MALPPLDFPFRLEACSSVTRGRQWLWSGGQRQPRARTPGRPCPSTPPEPGGAGHFQLTCPDGLASCKEVTAAREVSWKSTRPNLTVESGSWGDHSESFWTGCHRPTPGPSELPWKISALTQEGGAAVRGITPAPMPLVCLKRAVASSPSPFQTPGPVSNWGRSQRRGWRQGKLCTEPLQVLAAGRTGQGDHTRTLGSRRGRGGRPSCAPGQWTLSTTGKCSQARPSVPRARLQGRAAFWL